MEAYSLDLKERVAAACDEGSRSRSEIAEDFGVSVSFITKLLYRRKCAGGGIVVAAKPHRGGFASAIDAEAETELKSLVRQQPDATLQELRDRLAERRPGASRSVPVICRALQRLGLPRKKSPSTPRNGTRRVSAASVARSRGRSSRSPRSNASSWTSAARAPR